MSKKQACTMMARWDGPIRRVGHAWTGCRQLCAGWFCIGVFLLYHDGPASAAIITSMKATGPPAAVMTHAGRVLV